MIDRDSRLASDLSLAVMRLSRQLRFRRPQSPVSLSQLSALATLANFGPMTPGALAIRERVRPPSMTRVIASLAELGFVDRVPHPDDGRQVLVSVSDAGAELMEAERRASQEWLSQRLETLGASERDTLRVAADLILATGRRKPLTANDSDCAEDVDGVAVCDIDDPDDARLDNFRDLNSIDRRPDLPSGKGLVIAEGVLVVQRMLASPFTPLAFLGTDRRLAELKDGPGRQFGVPTTGFRPR